MTPIAQGDWTGAVFPAGLEGLRDGPEPPEAVLTRLLRAYGVLDTDNCVTAVHRLEAFTGGNSGGKALLDVTYRHDTPDLPTRLFAKFSRDFADSFRDRRRAEMDGEVRLTALARLPSFPIAVPRPVFADFEAASGSGLIITERIGFGENGIEPLHEKCRDHLLADPLGHYRALVSAQARLAASEHSGALSPKIDALFPTDREGMLAALPITFDADEMRRKARTWATFLRNHAQLFPATLTTPEFAARLEHDALALLRNEQAIRSFLHDNPRMIALCHWNANIDNAWFWREGDGTLHCGLLDWGMVRRMNLATGLWGGLSAATSAFLEAHLDGLLDHYREELAAHGGPIIPAETLSLHFDLSLALVGLSLMMDFPALAAARMPDIERATGPLDPLLSRDSVIEGFLLVSTNFLSLWERRDFGSALGRIL